MTDTPAPNKFAAEDWYDIGQTRSDGKRNIWQRVEMLPQQWVWVIVHVAYTLGEARDWIRGRRRRVRA